VLKMMLHDVDVAGAHFSPSKTLSGTGFNAKGEGSLAADYTEFFRSLTGTAVSERISLLPKDSRKENSGMAWLSGLAKTFPFCLSHSHRIGLGRRSSSKPV
jgi:hypothetical protein